MWLKTAPTAAAVSLHTATTAYTATAILLLLLLLLPPPTALVHRCQRRRPCRSRGQKGDRTSSPQTEKTKNRLHHFSSCNIRKMCLVKRHVGSFYAFEPPEEKKENKRKNNLKTNSNKNQTRFPPNSTKRKTNTSLS